MIHYFDLYGDQIHFACGAQADEAWPTETFVTDIRYATCPGCIARRR
jgi:hypothetical protein